MPPDALERVLRHLVTAGVVTRDDAGNYALTRMGEQLRGTGPDRLRSWLDIDGATGHADLCFVQLLHTVRTGEAAFPKHYGPAAAARRALHAASLTSTFAVL